MNPEIAKEILRQLGGNKFIAMTGARNFIAINNGLSFRLPGGGGFCKDGINIVQIVLDPSDTYTVTFKRVRGNTLREIARVEDVYNDNLRCVFETHTGLRTSL
jgi:hypothetical protein